MSSSARSGSDDYGSEWKELQCILENLGFRKAAYSKNALGGSNQIQGMSFLRGSQYINVKRLKGEKGRLTDRFSVELYDSEKDSSKEEGNLNQAKAWNIAAEAAKSLATVPGLKEFHTGYAPVGKKEKREEEQPAFFPSTLDFFTRPKEQKRLDEEEEHEDKEAHELSLKYPGPALNSKENVGRSSWMLLHSIAANLHDPPTPEEKRGILCLIKDLESVYPCVDCKEGFRFAELNPPDLSSRSTLETWLCRWHNHVNARMGKESVDCDPSLLHQAYQIGCVACERKIKAMEDQSALILEAERNHAPLTTPEMQRVVDIVITQLASKFEVPKPKILFEENVQFCPGTSCTIQDAKHPVETTHIYYNPRAFSLRTTCHEFYHYLASVLTADQIKKAVGFSFSGDPDDEQEADAFAYKVIEDLTNENKVRLNREESNGINGMPAEEKKQQQQLESIKVMKQELAFSMTGGATQYGPVFNRLADIYTAFEPYANMRAEDLNNIYSPEIFGTALGIGYDLLLTPLGAVVANVLSWAFFAWVGSQRNLAYSDRYFLNEWAAYHGSRIMLLAEPGYLSAATGSARAMGAAVGSGRAGDALQQLARNPNEVAGGFRAAFNAVQQAFAQFKLPNLKDLVPGQSSSALYQQPTTNIDGGNSGFN